MRINPDNTVIHTMTAIFDVAFTYILYLLCCLPVVTIGVATASFHATMLSIAEDTCSGVFRKFFGAFKENLKIASEMWLIFAVAGVLVIADVVICFGFNMEQESSLLYIMRGITLFCAALYVLMFHYTFAGIAKFKVTKKQALHNALLFVTKYPLSAMGVLLLTVAAAVCFYFGLIWALPVVMVLVYLQEIIIRNVFNKTLGIKRDKHMRDNSPQFYE